MAALVAGVTSRRLLTATEASLCCLERRPDVPSSPQAQRTPTHTSPLFTRPLIKNLSLVRWALPREGLSLGGHLKGLRR